MSPLSSATVWTAAGGQLVRGTRGVVIPGGGGTPTPVATVPSAPTVTAAAPAATSASLSWSVPSSDGGSPITGYVVSRSGSPPWSATVAATARTHTFLSLSPSSVYILSVAAVNAVGVGPAASRSVTIPAAAPSGQRFPGDSNPAVTGKVYWGQSKQGGGSVTYQETATGVSVAVRRRFWTPAASAAAITPPNGGLINAAKEDHAANRLPVLSWRETNWAGAAAGASDALWDSLIAYSEGSLTKPVLLGILHEPENDTAGTTAQYRAIQARFRARLNAYVAQNGPLQRVSFGGIWMGYTFDPSSGRNPLTWYPGDGVWDWLGVDVYSTVTQEFQTSRRWLNFVAFIKEHGMSGAMTEWGIRPTDPEGVRKMRSFWEYCLTGVDDIIFASYFDSNVGAVGADGGTTWELSDSNGLLTEYRRILKTPQVMRLSNLGY